MKTSAIVLTTAAAILLLASCAKDEVTALIPAPSTTSVIEAEIDAQIDACARHSALLLNTKWELQSLNGIQIRLEPDTDRPWVKMTAGNSHRLDGFGGCNQLMGTFALSCGALAFSDLGSTMVHCENTHDLEQRFLAALGRTGTFEIAGSSLTLLHGSVQLATLVTDRGSSTLLTEDQ